MAQAIVDPQELRRFAGELRSFNLTLRDQMGRLHAGFRQLGETWRDQEQRRFAQEFEQTAKVLNRFMQESERYITYLHRKAKPVEEYLQQR